MTAGVGCQLHYCLLTTINKALPLLLHGFAPTCNAFLEAQANHCNSQQCQANIGEAITNQLEQSLEHAASNAFDTECTKSNVV